MKHIIKLILLILFLCGMAIIGLSAQGSKVAFTVDAPKEVETGTSFQVVFELNREVDQFEGPDFKGFEILGGPGYSESRYSSFINGKRSSEIKITYTYALKATREGKYEIGSALARMGRTVLKTSPLTITVRGKSTGSGGKQPFPGEGEGDIFILNHVSKSNPYKGEVIVLTQKLYTRLAINNIGRVKLPSFNGFWSEQIDIGNYTVTQETRQGKVYNTLILNRTLLIPQRTGRITLEPSSVMIQRVVEKMVNRQVWGGVVQQRVRELVDHEIKSSALVIEVKDLPSRDRPESFSGAVGNFTLETQLSSDKVGIGEPVELKVRISGTGNIKLLDKPFMQISRSLDIFEPEIRGKVTVNASGMSGEREYGYLVIPRDTGRYEIPGIEFSYFDPSTQRYTRRVAPAQRLQAVKNGKSGKYNTSSMDKEDVTYFGRDIRYIKPQYATPAEILLRPGSWLHIILLAAPAFMLAIILLYYRKRVRLHADRPRMRSLKAMTLAKQRLKLARKAMEMHDRKEFFGHILEALWGFVSDKLDLPLAELSKNRIKQAFEQKGATTESIEPYVRLIEDCEYARYAPAGDASRMDKTLEEAMGCIDMLDAALTAIEQTKNTP